MEFTRWKIAGVAAVVALLVAIFIAQYRQANEPPPVLPTTTVTVTPSASKTPLPIPTDGGRDDIEHAVDEAAQQEIIEVSRAFATDWSTPTEDAKVWVKKVRRHAVDSLAKKFEFIDIENVPVTGKVTKVEVTDPSEPVATSVATFEKGQRIRIKTIFTPGKGWKVFTFERA